MQQDVTLNSNVETHRKNVANNLNVLMVLYYSQEINIAIRERIKRLCIRRMILILEKVQSSIHLKCLSAYGKWSLPLPSSQPFISLKIHYKRKDIKK